MFAFAKKGFVVAAVGSAALAASAGAAGISVKPSTGVLGTSYTISFMTPTAAAAGYYHVRARAANTHGGSCVATLDFTNPKPVSAALRLRFSFRPTGAEELCAGTWSVTVANPAGTTLLSGGSFTLGKQGGANTPSKPKPTKPTPATPTTPTTSGSGLTVKPSSGRLGTSFTIAFKTPAGEAAHALDVHGSANSAHSGSCVSTLNFSNPRAESAGVSVQFSFTPTAAEQLCTGAWTVTVRDAASGKTLLAGGKFTLQ